MTMTSKRYWFSVIGLACLYIAAIYCDSHRAKAQSSAWTPAQLPGCFYFFVADDLNLSNGSNVTTWSSRCGSTTATANGSPYPTFATGANSNLNGRATVAFTGASNPYGGYMALNSTLQAQTVYAVVRMNTTASYNGVLAATSASVAQAAFDLAPYGAGAGKQTFFVTNSANTAGIASSSSSPIFAGSNGNYMLIGGTSSVSGSTISTAVSVNRQHPTATSALATPYQTITNEVMGADYYGQTIYDGCQCNLAMVFASSSVLTTAQIKQLEDWIELYYFAPLPSGNISMFGYSSSNGQPNLQVSSNGTTWTNKAISVYGNQSNWATVKDASVIRTNNGYFMASSYSGSSSTPATVDIYSSAYGGLWVWIASPTICGGTLSTCEGPSWFVDSNNSVYLLAANSNAGSSANIVYIQPTNAGYTTWSSPTTILSGLSTGYDPFMVKVGSTYHLLIGNGNIGHYTSSSISGTYTLANANILSASGRGPWAVRPTAGLAASLSAQWLVGYDPGSTSQSYAYCANDFSSCGSTSALTMSAPYAGGYQAHGAAVRAGIAGGGVQ